MSASIERVIEPRPRDLGGFEVRRVLPAAGRNMVGPFIFFDHLGPAQFAAGAGIDVRPHPHICLATVTYLFTGELVHRDSLGFVQPIRPGDVNWMTAGRGIVHSERTDAVLRQRSTRIHGIQSWVALPTSAEETEPAFFHHPAATLPLIERPGVRMRVIAGTAWGERSPVATFSKTLYVDAELAGGARLELADEHRERALYVADGRIALDAVEYTSGHMIVLDPGGKTEIRALADSRVMLVGGEPLDGPRYIWWNFVASSQERIEQGKRDWAEQRFPRVPGETEFIPLPDR
ncbi:MAG TPA: pirin family protein [Steroidobacteraceae bacterium]|nr:pirin family protein [Steroidobacteraceae bacterium]